MRHSAGLPRRHTCQVEGHLEVGLRQVGDYLEVG